MTATATRTRPRRIALQQAPGPTAPAVGERPRSTHDIAEALGIPRQQLLDLVAAEAELRHYSIQETADLLGVSKRWLAGLVAARQVGCTFIANQAKFTAAHIRQLSTANEVDPAAIGRRTA
ncbi:hypothetical protein [Kitasatospora sp. NPDC058046]|uniref:hypothetical protein n=1 Tax=Kitasatospora sp. NPDC058046 TaxID=3346312 RepID=UPI0036DA2F78